MQSKGWPVSSFRSTFHHAESKLKWIRGINSLSVTSVSNPDNVRQSGKVKFQFSGYFYTITFNCIVKEKECDWKIQKEGNPLKGN
jgi:hypothetical protein